MYTEIKKLYRNTNDFLGSNVRVGGWIRTVRNNKNFGFIELNDGSFFNSVQIVFNNNLNNYNEVAKLNVGSSITVMGKVVESPGEKQTFEIHADEIIIEGHSTPDYPLQKKRHSLEYLRTMAHLRPRTNTFSAVFRIRSIASYAIHKYFNEKNFVYVHTPIITASDCEGAGEMFQVTTLDMNNLPKDKDGNIDYAEDFFGKMANLTVSGQLAVENFCMALRNVYTFGPTFRAENSNTSRHAAEFWMMEPELAFADLNDNMDSAEEMFKYVIQYCMENAPEEIEFFNKFIDTGLIDRLNNVLNSEFGRISYTEAIDILQNADHKFEYPVYWGADIQSEHERYLAEVVFKKPVFLTGYPKEITVFPSSFCLI